MTAVVSSAAVTEPSSHWRDVWQSKRFDEVSWYEAHSQPSLGMVLAAARPDERVTIVGAGASTLVIDLVTHGCTQIDAVDIAEPALRQLTERLGGRCAVVNTICGDVRTLELDGPTAVWHDRAVFHFLTDPVDQDRYVERAAAVVRPGGTLIVATFAPDGPEQCSGLPVARHDVHSLEKIFALDFELIESFQHIHLTPWGGEQPFTYARFQRSAKS